MSSSKLLLIMTISLGMVIVFGCSSHQPVIDTQEGMFEGADDQSEIDELFRIINQSESQKDDRSAEDEVFELLGIQKEQKEQAAVGDQATSDQQLKKEIELLEQRLADKEAEISELRTSIETKDKEIDKMESGAVRTAQPASAQITGNFKQDYQLALEEYNRRNYKKAIQMFQDLLLIDRNNSLSDNCQYWIGESYYGLGNYNQAIIEFTKVFSFARSNKMDDAQLKLGLCYWRLGDNQRAIQELERLLTDYPDSEYQAKAQQFLSRLQ
ncbi:MAG: tetratricopeptide repeat protein [bacterium]|nr:tetratricopeptide repeat protein [bacterium]